MNNTDIIVIKQLPVIVEQLQNIKAEVTEKVNAALSLVCTEDTVKDVKKVRANLTQDFKFLEDRRKEVKKAILSPYEQFECIYKDCVSDVFKKADNELKNKIDSVENELKEQKRQEVVDYFKELCQANGIDFVSYEKANINVTLSASLKSLKEQAKAFVERIGDDLNLIATQQHKEEILYEYKQTLNVAGAITTVVNRYKAIDEAKAREAERKAKEEAEKEAAKKVEVITETLTPPTVVPPEERGNQILTLNFTVRGTRAQLKALKDYLQQNNYDFE